jgi:Ca2+-binding EF-hand superfamily protein
MVELMVLMTVLRKLNNSQHGDKNMLNQIKDALKKLFGFVDANKDGKVDLAEITAAVDKAEAKVEEVKAVVKKARKPKAK